jgi:hypothetical protein
MSWKLCKSHTTGLGGVGTGLPSVRRTDIATEALFFEQNLYCCIWDAIYPIQDLLSKKPRSTKLLADHGMLQTYSSNRKTKSTVQCIVLPQRYITNWEESERNQHT